MNKFTLRQRTAGKAFIPTEKQNDTEFIQEAEKNYHKYVETGKYSI